MPYSRRSFLARALGAGLSAWAFAAGLVPRLAAAADPRPAFDATAIADALAAIGANEARESDAIALRAPDIAENGAVVPVEIESSLADTRAIAILVEKNPHVLSAEFLIPDGTEPYVATRVKVAESSLIHAVVKTADGAYYTTKLVKVTLGGCGG